MRKTLRSGKEVPWCNILPPTSGVIPPDRIVTREAIPNIMRVETKELGGFVNISRRFTPPRLVLWEEQNGEQ